MKWEEVTLEPGETKTFTYYVGMYSILKGNQTVINQTTALNAVENDENYMKDELSYRVENKIIPAKKGSVETVINKIKLSYSDDSEVILKGQFRVVDANGNELTVVEPTAAYDQNTKEYIISFPANLVPDDGLAYVEYTVDTNLFEDDYVNQAKELHSNVLHQGILKSGSIVEYNTDTVVQIKKKEIPPIPVKYLDEQGNVIKEESSVVAEYNEDFSITADDINGYSYKTTQGISDGKTVQAKFLEQYTKDGEVIAREIVFIYQKKPVNSPVVEVKKQLPDAGQFELPSASVFFLVAAYLLYKRKTTLQ